MTDKQGLEATAWPHIRVKANEGWGLNIESGTDPVHSELRGSKQPFPLSCYMSGKNNPIWSLAF